MSLYGLCGKRNILKSKQMPRYFSSCYLRKRWVYKECKTKPCSLKELHPVIPTIKLNGMGGWKQQQTFEVNIQHLEAMQKQYPKVLIRYKGTVGYLTSTSSNLKELGFPNFYADVRRSYKTQLLSSLELGRSGLSTFTGYFWHYPFDCLKSPPIFIRTFNVMYI